MDKLVTNLLLLVTLWKLTKKFDKRLRKLYQFLLVEQIRYSTTEASDEVSYKVVESSETVSAHVIGLKKFVEYRLQVLAFTRIGDGTLSTPPIIVKTHEDGVYVVENSCLCPPPYHYKSS